MRQGLGVTWVELPRLVYTQYRPVDILQGGRCASIADAGNVIQNVVTPRAGGERKTHNSQLKKKADISQCQTDISQFSAERQTQVAPCKMARALVSRVHPSL